MEAIKCLRKDIRRMTKTIRKVKAELVRKAKERRKEELWIEGLDISGLWRKANHISATKEDLKKVNRLQRTSVRLNKGKPALDTIVEEDMEEFKQFELNEDLKSLIRARTLQGEPAVSEDSSNTQESRKRKRKQWSST